MKNFSQAIIFHIWNLMMYKPLIFQAVTIIRSEKNL